MDIYNQLVMGLKKFSNDTGIKRAVIGLSGGLDSAVVAVLAAEAFGAGNVFCIAMPSQYSSDLSNEAAAELAGRLGVNFTVQPITPAFNLLGAQLLKDFEDGITPLAAQNLQSRVRGLIIMAFANQLNAAALACGNKSEIYTGYCTLYGDTVGAIAPIADLYKTEVYKLADYINRNKEIIPRVIITRPPTAELAPGQKDEDELLPYPQLDIIIEEYVFKKSSLDIIGKKSGAPKSEVERIIKKINGSAFKLRFLAPGIEVKK